MYFLVILLNYFIFPVVVLSSIWYLYTELNYTKKRNSCVSSWFGFFFLLLSY